MCIDELMEEIVNSDNIDKKMVLLLMAKGIKCKCEAEDMCEEIYRCAYGNILKPSLCAELISKMSNEEQSGAIWTLDETNAVAKKLEIDFSTVDYTPEEFRCVMTMEYYEHNIPLKKSGVTLEATGWGRFADYALRKDPCKLVNYYFA